MSRLIIGIGDIADGDALRTIFCPYPVGIGKIDADSRRRILITAEHSCTDDIRRNTLNHRLTETRIYGRMILKPLGIAADCPGTLSGSFIDILHQSFPRAFQSQRITIDFDKAVDEIDGRIMLFQPFNTIFIESL